MKRLTTLVMLTLVLMGCSRQTDEQKLYEQLDAHLQASLQAQGQALAHWDALILGDAANCQQGLPVPQPFTLTQSQADAYPPALPIRDALNQGIAKLADSASIWDSICANPDSIVAAELVNQGYLVAVEAGSVLELAQAAQQTWVVER